MLIAAIILALFLIYLINVNPMGEIVTPRSSRRVGSIFAYNDIFDPTRADNLPINTVAGPGGGSFIKKFD